MLRFIKYHGPRHGYKWQCNICDTIWDNSWYNIHGKKQWCPQCAIAKNAEERKGYTISDLKQKAKENNGECLSEEYINFHYNYEWKCNKCNYTWTVSFGSILEGHWCASCAGNAPLSLEDLQEKAKEKNGKCLSKEYISMSQGKMKFQCVNGHIFDVLPSNIIYNNSWCPYCKNKSESKFREVIEEVLCAKFPKVRPQWLTNDKNYKLELDGYNKILKVSFEYQGIQHFQSVKYFGGKKAFAKRQKHDLIKKEVCKKRGIILLTPSYELDEEDYKQYIYDNLNV